MKDCIVFISWGFIIKATVYEMNNLESPKMSYKNQSTLLRGSRWPSDWAPISLLRKPLSVAHPSRPFLLGPRKMDPGRDNASSCLLTLSLGWCPLTLLLPLQHPCSAALRWLALTCILNHSRSYGFLFSLHISTLISPVFFKKKKNPQTYCWHLHLNPSGSGTFTSQWTALPPIPFF